MLELNTFAIAIFLNYLSVSLESLLAPSSVTNAWTLRMRRANAGGYLIGELVFGGFIGSLFSFLQFVAIIGGMSDLYGRRPLLLLSTLCIAVSYGVWAMASSFYIFVLAWAIGGLSKGNVSLATAIVTVESTPKTRGKGMSLIGDAFSKERSDNWYVCAGADESGKIVRWLCWD